MRINSVKWNPQFANIGLLEKNHQLYTFSLLPYRRLREMDLTPVPYYLISLTDWHEMGDSVMCKLGLEIQ